jgi:hypothetical protein
MEQVLVMGGAKPSMMENACISVLPQLKRITFGRILRIDENTWTFRRDRDTTFLAYIPDSKIESQVESFFKKYEETKISDHSSWKEFHGAVGSILGYPETAREAYGDGQIIPSFYDSISYSPWVYYPYVSFSPSISYVQEAIDISYQNEQVIEKHELGEIVIQYITWFEKAYITWQDPQQEMLEDLITCSHKLLGKALQIEKQMHHGKPILTCAHVQIANRIR